MSDLSQRDEIFLNCLFDAENNPESCLERAREMAGFDKDESVAIILRRIKGDYQNEVQNYFLSMAPAAAKKLQEIAEGSVPILDKDKVTKACIEILDRAGVSKKEKQELEITAPEGVVILPPLNNTSPINNEDE